MPDELPAVWTWSSAVDLRVALLHALDERQAVAGSGRKSAAATNDDLSCAEPLERRLRARVLVLLEQHLAVEVA